MKPWILYRPIALLSGLLGLLIILLATSCDSAVEGPLLESTTSQSALDEDNAYEETKPDKGDYL